MPQISIVIPFFGKEKELESTLVSVLENRPADCEIIVAHSGNYSDPYDLKDEVQFVEFDSVDFSIGKVLFDLLDQIQSPVIHLLASGVQVSHGWSVTVTEAFEDSYVGSASPILLNENDSVLTVGVENTLFYHNGYLGTGTWNHSHDLTTHEPVGPTQLAGFYRTSALAEITCLREFSDNMFGLETGLALEAIGYEVKVIESNFVVSEGVELPRATGTESQKAIWRFAGSIGWLQGLLLTIAAIVCDVCKSPFQAASRRSLADRLSCPLDSRTAGEFREFVDLAHGPQPDGATIPMTKSDLPLAGFVGEQEQRAA